MNVIGTNPEGSEETILVGSEGTMGPGKAKRENHMSM